MFQREPNPIPRPPADLVGPFLHGRSLSEGVQDRYYTYPGNRTRRTSSEPYVPPEPLYNQPQSQTLGRTRPRPQGHEHPPPPVPIWEPPPQQPTVPFVPPPSSYRSKHHDREPTVIEIPPENAGPRVSVHLVQPPLPADRPFLYEPAPPPPLAPPPYGNPYNEYNNRTFNETPAPRSESRRGGSSVGHGSRIHNRSASAASRAVDRTPLAGVPYMSLQEDFSSSSSSSSSSDDHPVVPIQPTVRGIPPTVQIPPTGPTPLRPVVVQTPVRVTPGQPIFVPRAPPVSFPPGSQQPPPPFVQSPQHRQESNQSAPSQPYTEYSAKQLLSGNGHGHGRRVSFYDGRRPDLLSSTSGSESASVIAPLRLPSEHLFLSFPTPQTMKISNIRPFNAGSGAGMLTGEAMIRTIRERVTPSWSPGITFEREGSGEYVIRFAGLGEGNQRLTSHGLSNSEKKKWGVWTGRGAACTTAIRILAATFNVLAEYGHSYNASIQSVPHQYVFASSPIPPAAVTLHFLAMQILVTPLKPKKITQHLRIEARKPRRVVDKATGQPLVVPGWTVKDPLSDKPTTLKTTTIKLDVSHVEIRCVDFPVPVLKSVLAALRGVTVALDSSMRREDSPDPSKKGKPVPEFGVVHESWDSTSVYILNAVLNRGTGRRSLGKDDLRPAAATSIPKSPYNGSQRHSHQLPQEVLPSDIDTLPFVTAEILKAMEAEGFELEASIPLPPHVPLVDPTAPINPSRRNSEKSQGFSWSSLMSALRGEAPKDSGYGREVWVFRSFPRT
ncbi:hypothetical protein FRB99_006847 [Tulasnella sp. 403]|nr:hypothetical protein FRB99_006847 [Tulasnella sp. 403]